MSALPDGAAWYAYDVKVMTTTSRTPQQIHDLGLSEVKRIRAEMDSVMRSTGFTGDFAAFATMLRTDPRFFYTDSASLVRRIATSRSGSTPSSPNSSDIFRACLMASRRFRRIRRRHRPRPITSRALPMRTVLASSS